MDTPDIFGLPEQVDALEGALPAATGDEAVAVRIELAWYLRQSDTARALALAEEATTLAGASLAAVHRARLALLQGEAHRLDHRTDAAMACVEAARHGFESLGDQLGLGDTAWVASGCAHGRSDLPLLMAGLKQSAEWFAQAGDPVRSAIVAVFRAIRDALTQPPDAVLARWQAQIDEARRLRHPVSDAHLAQLDGMLTAAASAAKAFPHYERSWSLARRTRQRRLEWSSAQALADRHRSAGDLEQALLWNERAAAAAAPWPLLQGGVLGLSSRILHELGRPQAALEHSERALELIGIPEEWGEGGWLMVHHGRTLFTLGRHEEALAWSQRAVRAGRRDKAPTLLLLRALIAHAEALCECGTAQDALAAVDEALSLAESDSAPADSVEAIRVKARIAARWALPAPPGSTAPNACIHALREALCLADRTQGLEASPALHAELSRALEAIGQNDLALQHERLASAARERDSLRKAQALAVSQQARLQAEQARAEATEQRELAAAHARRADAEAAANVAKSAFLASMNHELRSPLNALLGMARLVERDATLPGPLKDDMGVVLRSGRHLQALIDQVLTLSKIEAGRLDLVERAFDVHELLEEALALLGNTAADKGLELRLARGPEVPRHALGDAVRLRQVLLNLLGNAIKFTRRGHVALQARAAPMDEAPGRCLLTLEVADTGIGIAPEDLAQLGQPFVQASAGRDSREGTGLGLAISRGFAERMGGSLRIDSRPGAGTCVTVTVPLSVSAQPERAADAAPPRVLALADGQPTRRILVVDDLPDGRQVLVRLLRPLGFEVREATDGAEAVATWQAWSPHMILMDLRMPVMDGREATRRIKAGAADHPTVVIALTASSFDEEREDILAAGCDDYLRKPFDEELLLQAIARHLGVTYVREQPASAALPPDDACLEHLPAGLKARLVDALERLDVRGIEGALDEVRRVDAAAADSLQPLARQFDYERLKALLR